MKIKYKTSIAIFLIFALNLALLLGYYELSLKPNMSETIKETIQIGIFDKIRSNISSEAEANNLITEIQKSVANDSFRNSISSRVTEKILIFEAYVLFLLLIFLSIVLYLRYVKPIEELIQSMDNFSRGIVPKVGKNRKDEIGQLQNKFVELTKSLETEKQKQNRIIASISHDIKTPLTVVMGYSERILKNDFPKDKEKRYLHTIYSKSQSINEIINEFDEYLSYNLESALSLKEYDVSYICNFIELEYTEELSDIGVNFTVVNKCGNSKLLIDLLKFKRVIGNLVGNSIKHMSHNPAICLTVTPNESGTLFTFTDNGIGVPEDELPFIFDPLYTSDSSRKVAGLGLSICKNIITAHNGTITAKNRTTGGLQIDVLLKNISM